MRKSDNPTSRDYDDYVASALGTEGGHLSIGRGGFTLYNAHGARLSGYDCEQVKACCIAAGLPVIDGERLSRSRSRGVQHPRPGSAGDAERVRGRVWVP